MKERELLKNLLHDLKPARRTLIIGMLFYIPVTVLSVIQPVIIGYTVQHAMTTKGNHALWLYTSVFLAVVIALAFCELMQGIALQTTGQIFVANLREKAFAKAQKLSMGFLDSTPMGRLLTRLTNDTESVVEMFSMGAVQILGDSLFLIGTFVMLFVVDVELTLYSALILPLLVVGIAYFRHWAKKAYVQVRQALSTLNGFLQEYLSGMSTVQISNQVNTAHNEFTAFNNDFLQANQRSIMLDAAIYSFVDALSYFASALVLWGAFRLDLRHALSLGILVAFLEALARFFQPVRELSNRYAIFQSALVSLERIYELLSWPEEHDISGEKSRPFLQNIEFKNVSFAYQKNGPALTNVSFTLNKGERIALVGPTGAGKSTVIKLLNRFYPVNSGQILLDGNNIDDLPLSATRRLISVVPQEGFLFHGTLRDNLGFGNPTAHDDQLWHALELVQLRDIIERKGGLSARVLPKGQNFSLGERQLLAIARALVTDPPILILDEATASIDSPTEKRLQMAIKELLARRTALVIAHRLTTILDADRVLVFERGNIVEEGSHSVLMRKNGVYADLIRAHTARFDIGVVRA